MQSLELQANIKGWSKFRKRRSDKSFQATRQQVFQRDHFQCQFCGFIAKKYQQIVNLDGNYYNNQQDNMVTSCVLCAQCHFLGCGQFGTMVYLPEYSQVELNQVARVLFCAMHTESLYQETARTLYRSFRNRSKEVDEIFGEQSSDCAVFGQSIIDAGLENNANSHLVFDHLRLLPFRTPLSKPIEHWCTLVNKYW